MSVKRLVLLLLTIIPEATLDTSLTPLYPFIVRYFDPNAEPSQKTSLLMAAFYIPVLFTNYCWGKVLDSRSLDSRSILLLFLCIGLVSSVVIATCTSVEELFFARIMLGVFGASASIVKSILGQQFPDRLGLAYAWYGAVYGITLLLGPLLGASLAFPMGLNSKPFWWTELLTLEQKEFLKSHPLVLLGAGSAMAYFSVAVLYATLGDDQGTHYSSVQDEIRVNDSYHLTEDDSVFSQLIQGPDLMPTMSLNPALPSIHEASTLTEQTEEVQSLTESTAFSEEYQPSFAQKSIPFVLYTLVAVVVMTYMTLLPLYFSTARSNGGLEYDSVTTSMLFTIMGTSKLISQLLAFERLSSFFAGSKLSFEFGILLYLLSFIAIVFGAVSTYSRSVLVVIMIGIAECFGYLSAIVMTTESFPLGLGQAHGISATTAALGRIFAPILAGYFWELGSLHSMPTLSFGLDILFCIIGLLLTKLVLNVPTESWERSAADTL